MNLIRQRASEAFISKAFDTYSQYQEDLVLDGLLGRKDSGFYVDIGANDPRKFNNTYRFYKRGWTGINIEPNAVRHADIATARPRDVNLNMGVGTETGSMPFHAIDPDTLSTFDKGAAEQAEAAGYKVAPPVDVPISTLSAILAEHAAGRHVDFMSIDVEGYEVSVLASNDWEANRPSLVMLETNRDEDGIRAAMHGYGYRSVFSNGTNTIYADARWKS